MGVSVSTGVGRAAHSDKNAACAHACLCMCCECAILVDGISVHVDGRVSG